MFALMQWSVDRGLVEYVSTRETARVKPVTEQLALYYAEQESWANIASQPQILGNILRENGFLRTRKHPPPLSEMDHRNPEELSKNNDHRFEADGIRKPHRQLQAVLLNKDKKTLIGVVKPTYNYKQYSIVQQGSTVGWLLLPERKKITEGYELQFLEQQRSTFILISLIVIALSALFAFPLARHFVGPINHLARATYQLTLGNYQQQIKTKRRDELGQLARDFNELAQNLSQVDRARKRWLADTSHELRTPLAIIRGEIEAMLDNVRPLNEENLQSVFNEIIHLNILVNDLHELSNADIGGLHYKKSTVNINELLNDISETFTGALREKKLTLAINHPRNTIYAWADPKRLQQLFDNLISNSIKYTNSDGQLVISIATTEDCINIRIEDSAPSVDEQSMGKLFDHLYRAEASRNRSTGGSGLGLAICKRIVEAHRGEISATGSALGGIAIDFSLEKSRKPI